MTDPTPTPASTPAASAAMAQSRGVVPEADAPAEPRPAGPAGASINPGLYRAVRAQPYERRPGDPIYRPLQIYTLHPGASRREGAVARVNVPYEPLAPGPEGQLFIVEETATAETDGLRYQRVDLDAPRVLLDSGRRPSPSDPQFHQQMVYAVCSLTYAAFRKALGRDLAWGFDGAPDGDGRVRLRIRPHARQEANAFYHPTAGTLNFGYYPVSAEATGRTLPGGYTFTCLSHDVVTHEMTHALLDGLRAHFGRPGTPDVLAFHEAFADLVALFQRFSYPEVVRSALRQARGHPAQSAVLTGLAHQMAQATGQRDGAIRSAVRADAEGTPPQYAGAPLEPHARGEVLVGAVFEAFLEVFQRKAARLLRLATGGTGVLPEGDLPADLVDALADKASSLAGQFLTMCIRAIDYCPPVDIEFGEFLRAVVTADHDLVPDDPWGYREAWIDAFWRRGIYPSHVRSLAEDALLWRPPPPGTPPIPDLSFSRLAFDLGPGRAAGKDELKRRATALADALSDPATLDRLWLSPTTSEGDDHTDRPCIQSIRSSRRVGPDGQVIFDLVAEVTQDRVLPGPDGPMRFYGGSTVIIGPRGEIRYVISKSTTSTRRLELQQDFLQTDVGRLYWRAAHDDADAPESLFQLIHSTRETP